MNLEKASSHPDFGLTIPPELMERLIPSITRAEQDKQQFLERHGIQYINHSLTGPLRARARTSQGNAEKIRAATRSLYSSASRRCYAAGRSVAIDLNAIFATAAEPYRDSLYWIGTGVHGVNPVVIEKGITFIPGVSDCLGAVVKSDLMVTSAMHIPIYSKFGQEDYHRLLSPHLERYDGALAQYVDIFFVGGEGKRITEMKIRSRFSDYNQFSFSAPALTLAVPQLRRIARGFFSQSGIKIGKVKTKVNTGLGRKAIYHILVTSDQEREIYHLKLASQQNKRGSS